MILPRLAERDAGFLLLLTTALRALPRDARMPHDRCQLLLILRGMKAAIERRPLDLAPETLLQLLHGRYHQILVQHAAAHHCVMTDETHRIFDHQHVVTKLHRVGLLAALDQLSVRLEDAEDLLLILDRFPQEDAAPCGVADLARQVHIMLQFAESHVPQGANIYPQSQYCRQLACAI